MTGRLFFDTNLLVYVLDPVDGAKRSRASDLVRRSIADGTFVVSPQTLNECYRVLTDKRGLVPVDAARRYIEEFVPFCDAPLDSTTTRLAFHVQDALRASWFDSLMFASALQAGCRLFLSEDMQGNREMKGLRIVDPFKSPSTILS